MPQLNIISTSVRYLLFISLFLVRFPISNLQAQETVNPEEISPTEVTPEDVTQPETSPPTDQFDSIFSIEGGKKLMTEADQAVDAQQYDVAAKKLQSARQVFNQLSNFYLQLFNSFSGVDNIVAESHRKKALETGIERDRATYQLALVHRAQEQPELSIPLLVQIITSQSPTSGMGKKAYEQLLEIGFVDAPLSPPKKRNTQPETPATPEPNSAPATDPAQPQIPGDQPTIPSP